MGFMIRAEGSASHTPEPTCLFWSKTTTCFTTNSSDDHMPWPPNNRPVFPRLSWTSSSICASCKWMWYITALVFLVPAPRFTNPHSWLSVALCLCSSFPLSSRDTSFSAQQAVCPFITWLSFLSLSLSLRGGLQWIFITLQVNLHYGVLCVLLLVQIHTRMHTGVLQLQNSGYYNLNIQKKNTRFPITAQLKKKFSTILPCSEAYALGCVKIM